MAGQLATQAVWTLDSTSQGNVRLRRVKSSKTADASSTEMKNAIGEDFPVGFIDKPGGKTTTFEIFVEQGNPEVDWQFLKDSKEYFSMTKQVVGGKRYQYPICRVAKVDKDDDDEGSHMMSVEVMALEEKPL